jgi:hypothetical protein
MITRDSIHTLDTAPRPRPRGRPRAVAPLSPVSIRFADAEHDRLIVAATARGLSVSAYVRLAVRVTLARPAPRRDE